jgi:hypothetical protein
MESPESSVQPIPKAVASVPHKLFAVQQGEVGMPNTTGAGQLGALGSGGMHAAAVPKPHVLVAMLAQHGGGALGRSAAAGLGGQVIVPQVTTELPPPAAPVPPSGA